MSTYLKHLSERLARSLEKSGFTRYSVDWVRRLGAEGCNGYTNHMQCLDENRFGIASFMLEGNVRKW